MGSACPAGCVPVATDPAAFFLPVSYPRARWDTAFHWPVVLPDLVSTGCAVPVVGVRDCGAHHGVGPFTAVLPTKPLGPG